MGASAFGCIRMTRDNVDFRLQQRRVLLRGVSAALFTAALLAVAVVVLPGIVAFPKDALERLVFALQANVFVAAWVVVAIRMVSRRRFSSPADAEGSAYAPPSERLAVRSAFLQNTLEQAFIAFAGNLILATVAGDSALAFIVAGTVLFSIGRVTFLMGYPKGAAGRAFGMVTTMMPAVCAIIWIVVVVLGRIFDGLVGS
jgi:hypothetical protein